MDKKLLIIIALKWICIVALLAGVFTAGWLKGVQDSCHDSGGEMTGFGCVNLNELNLCKTFDDKIMQLPKNKFRINLEVNTS